MEQPLNTKGYQIPNLVAWKATARLQKRCDDGKFSEAKAPTLRRHRETTHSQHRCEVLPSCADTYLQQCIAELSGTLACCRRQASYHENHSRLWPSPEFSKDSSSKATLASMSPRLASPYTGVSLQGPQKALAVFQLLSLLGLF